MIEKFLISRHDSLYLAWPDVALLPSGTLVCTFMRCIHHGNRQYTALCVTESADRGRTWSEPRALVEDQGDAYWNCARISRLRDGRLVIVCDHIVGWEHRQDDKLTNHLWFSDDDGATWDGPHATPAIGIVPDKLLELPDGRWLLSCHRRSPEHNFLEPRLWISADGGATWSDAITIASREGLHLCEGSILPLPDGTLVCYLRENSSQGWDAYKAISDDGGLTWHGPYRAPLPGCHRPVAGLLQSGKVLITHRFLQGGKGWVGTWTQNFFAALTDVESAKATERKDQWSRILPVDFDRSPHSDLGYSGWVQFPDGEIYIVNYIVDDWPRGQIRGYSLRESDFLLPG